MDKKTWKIEYDNDDHGGFSQWWNVTNGEKRFTCESEEDANWLLKSLLQSDDVVKDEWISVKDKLPENSGWCNDEILFAASGTVRKGCYDYEDGFWHEQGGGKYMDIIRVYDGDKENGGIVTHWKHLPKSPSQVSEGEKSELPIGIALLKTKQHYKDNGEDF